MMQTKQFGWKQAIGLAAMIVAMLVVGWVAGANPAGAATSGTSADQQASVASSASCYPASECDGTRSHSTGSSGYPAAPGVQNGDNYRGLLCPTLTAIAIGGAAPSGGMSMASAGTAAAASCGVAEFANQ